mgnify:CR=1 FL=1
MKNQKQNKLKPSKVMKYLFLFLSLAFLAFGCSSFQSTQRLDLSPFANSMITVAGDIQYSLFQHRLVSVRKAAKGPEVEKFAANVNKLRRIIRGIIAYSIEIVTVSESNKSGPEKANALADYLEGLKRPVLEEPIPELHLTVEQLDTIIMNVRSQKKFLDALAAAQAAAAEHLRVDRAPPDRFHPGNPKILLEDAGICPEKTCRKVLVNRRKLLCSGNHTDRARRQF